MSRPSGNLKSKYLNISLKFALKTNYNMLCQFHEFLDIKEIRWELLSSHSSKVLVKFQKANFLQSIILLDYSAP